MHKVEKESKLKKEKFLGKHRNKQKAFKNIMFMDNWIKIIYRKIMLEASFMNWTYIKNLNPVVIYNEYYVTISVIMMALYLMIFYENFYFIVAEYQNSLYNLSHFGDIFYNIYYSNVYTYFFKKLTNMNYNSSFKINIHHNAIKYKK